MKTNWMIVQITFAVGALFLLFVVVLNIVGLFEIPDNDTGGKATAAALALIGSLATAVLSLVGVLVKSSIDARTLELKRQAEERLRMETCIQAVGLFSTAAGNQAPLSQKAGALFAVANLGQLEFALALLMLAVV